MTTRRIAYHIWPRNLPFEKLVSWPKLFAVKRGYTTERKVMYHFYVDRFEAFVSTSTEQMVDLVVTHPAFKRLSWTLEYRNASDGLIESEMRFDGSTFEAAFKSDTLDLVNVAHSELKDQFQLRNPDDNETGLPTRHATIFLGRHFDEYSKPLAERLSRFMTLLGFRVIEGESFTPQTIPDKVRQRIEAQDIYLGLVTGRRAHDWITAEAAYAHAKGKEIILLVEENSEFKETLPGGSFQQVRFNDGEIEKTFVRLLEGFRAIKVGGIF